MPDPDEEARKKAKCAEKAKREEVKRLKEERLKKQAIEKAREEKALLARNAALEAESAAAAPAKAVMTFGEVAKKKKKKKKK